MKWNLWLLRDLGRIVFWVHSSGSNQNGDFLMNLQLVSCKRYRTSTCLEHAVFTTLQVTVMALYHSVTCLDLCSNPSGYNKRIRVFFFLLFVRGQWEWRGLYKGNSWIVILRLQCFSGETDYVYIFSSLEINTACLQQVIRHISLINCLSILFHIQQWTELDLTVFSK